MIESLTITINGFDNAAFTNWPEEEAARILYKLADRIRMSGLAMIDGEALIDVNGNKVGQVSTTSD